MKSQPAGLLPCGSSSNLVLVLIACLLCAFAGPGQEPTTQQTHGLPAESGFLKYFKTAVNPKADFDPNEFLKQHFFGYEPIYFLGGYERPRAKFQVSLRYQILNREGLLAQKMPALGGLSFAYTQTSVWDLGEVSSPFLDSSYKPEMLYLAEQVDGRRWASWIRMDIQGGVKHESNGNPEIDSELLDIGDRTSFYVENNGNGVRIKTSRSLNIIYVKPSFVFGEPDTLQLSLSPRAWVYFGGVEDNPDIADYRGYTDLEAKVGWRKGLQLLTTGRLGKHGDKGSLQFDLSYPMMRLLSGSFSAYLYVQYFTGYGESLLLYDRKSEALRFGFSLFR